MHKENFILNIRAYLQELASQVNITEFMFSYEEIDHMQEYFNCELTKEHVANESGTIDEQFYAYFGEAFKFYNGGRWEICNFNKDEAYKTPIIMDWGNDGFPHALISVYVWKEYLKRGLMDEKFTDIIKRAQIPMSNE